MSYRFIVGLFFTAFTFILQSGLSQSDNEIFRDNKVKSISVYKVENERLILTEKRELYNDGRLHIKERYAKTDSLISKAIWTYTDSSETEASSNLKITSVYLKDFKGKRHLIKTYRNDTLVYKTDMIFAPDKKLQKSTGYYLDKLSGQMKLSVEMNIKYKKNKMVVSQTFNRATPQTIISTNTHSNGRIVKTIFKNEPYDSHYKFLYSYSNDHLIRKRWIARKKYQNITDSFVYDSKGNLIEETRITNGRVFSRDVYTYGDSGLKTSTTSYTGNSGKLFTKYQYAFEFYP